MVTKAVLDTLYTPIYDRMLLQTYAEANQVHPQIFHAIEDKTSEYKTNGMSSLGEWVDADEAAGGGYEDPVKGYAKTLTQEKKIKAISISFEAVDQDEYALLGGLKKAETMGRGARMRVEKDTASQLYSGFATACPDGQYLFSDSHPKNREETGTTYDNLLSGAFSHDALEDAETQIMNNFFDPKGIPIETAGDPVLLYPPGIRGDVKRVLSDRALEQPDTNLRNINRFAGRYKPVEWRYLASIFGGSDTAWYILYPELELMIIVWSQHPHYFPWIDYEHELYNFKGRMIYDEGITDWRCGLGSTGL